jgi:phage terminase small subunit
MKPEVQAKIAELRMARMKRLQIDADELLQRLLELLNADLGDILGPDFELRPVSEWPEVWRLGLIAALKIRQVECDPAEASPARFKLVKIRLFDRMPLLRMIGNHVNVRAFR